MTCNDVSVAVIKMITDCFSNENEIVNVNELK